MGDITQAGFGVGFSGYLFTHEWPFYVLEALPMLVAVGTFVVWYPPHYIPKKTTTAATKQEMKSRDGRTSPGSLEEGLSG